MREEATPVVGVSAFGEVSLDRFNASALLIARRARGFTQGQLLELLREQEIKISQPTISRWEYGEAIPSTPEEEALSRVLKYPVSFFRNYVHPADIDSPSSFFRKAKSVGKRKEEYIRARVDATCMHLFSALQMVDLTPARHLPDIDLEDERMNVEFAAESARTSLGVGEDPIPNLVHAMEAFGCLVVKIDMNVPKVDGVGKRIGGTPVFLINSLVPTDRARFSLAHELGHIILKHGYASADEDEANLFASCLLMPRRHFTRDINRLGKLTLGKLTGLKSKWRVSIQAMIMRAKYLELIDDETSTALFKQMSWRGMRTSEPVQLSSEEPVLVKRLFAAIMNKFALSNVRDVARMCHCSVEDLLKITQGAFVKS